jgi:hypothetical protein
MFDYAMLPPKRASVQVFTPFKKTFVDEQIADVAAVEKWLKQPVIPVMAMLEGIAKLREIVIEDNQDTTQCLLEVAKALCSEIGLGDMHEHAAKHVAGMPGKLGYARWLSAHVRYRQVTLFDELGEELSDVIASVGTMDLIRRVMTPELKGLYVFVVKAILEFECSY